MWWTGRKLSKWVDIMIENPFKTWWKAREYFKRPKLRFRTFTTSWRAYKRGGRILEIDCMDVMWKDKFNSPRHEQSPHISILLFNKFGIRVDFHIDYYDEFGEIQNGDMLYWEYLLEWLYYKEKNTLKCYSSWTGNSQLYKTIKWGKAEDGSEDERIPMTYTLPCVAMSLNRRGIKELKRELNEERGNTQSYQIFSCEPGVLWSTSYTANQ